MKKIEFERKEREIADSLNNCPICKNKGVIIGCECTANELIIHEVGCLECHLSVKRKQKVLLDSNKIFSKRKTTIVDVVDKWNSITN